ncbi:MAG: LysM peptidoglycan-binding domain-containing protein [Myxococcales bacterium]|nr:LysM peptidoglycan-binding domain-containing protein [Myxococcales bacterium]
MTNLSTCKLAFLCCGLFAAVTTALPAPARAEQHHEVRSGQTLSAIARRYHISVSSLAAANGLTSQAMLKQGTMLRVPERGIVFVERGQTLGGLARAHGVGMRALASANRMKVGDPVYEGQRLVLPTREKEGHGSKDLASKRDHSSGREGAVRLYRVCTQQRLKLSVVDHRGRPRQAARRQLARLLRPRGSSRTRLPHPRLLELLGRVSNHFDGRTLVVISGYRLPGGRTSRTSRHTQGRAIDFKVDGISNRVLRNYLRTLPNVGVGYYPRSSFVHLDVRQTPAYWVDWSGPGEAPIMEKRRRSRLASRGDVSESDDVSEDTVSEVEALPQATSEDESPELVEDARPDAPELPYAESDMSPSAQ